MFLHVSVILFTGGVLLHCMLGYTPPQDQRQTPQEQTPPPPGPGTHLPPREKTPPWNRHPHPGAGSPPGADPPRSRPPRAGPPWSRHPPQEQAPPWIRPPQRSACWEIRATSGRYASYWNAIMLELFLYLAR